MFYRDIK